MVGRGGLVGQGAGSGLDGNGGGIVVAQGVEHGGDGDHGRIHRFGVPVRPRVVHVTVSEIFFWGSPKGASVPRPQ